MGRKNSNGKDRTRQMVAQEAARIIVNQGIRDYRVAKMKAVERLGTVARGSMPGNAEIESAISEYHTLFGGEDHAAILRSLREFAIEAMELLAQFTPRLVGPVLNGTADHNSSINLHLFADDTESIAMRLEALDIPYRPYERRLKKRRDQAETYSGFEFRHDTAAVQATVFPVDGIRQAPLSPIDGKPMDRADAARVRSLVES